MGMLLCYFMNMLALAIGFIIGRFYSEHNIKGKREKDSGRENGSEQ